MDKIVSNAVFAKLTEKCGPRLRSWAAARAEKDPDGVFTPSALQQVMAECKYSAAENDVRWLKNLQLFHSSGRLARLLKGQFDFDDHVTELKRLKAQKKIPYAINEQVIDKATGKLGHVIDYNVADDTYVVVLNPFQMRNMKPSDLMSAAGGDK